MSCALSTFSIINFDTLDKMLNSLLMVKCYLYYLWCTQKMRMCASSVKKQKRVINQEIAFNNSTKNIDQI